MSNITLSDLPRSRKEATASNLKHYYTAKPCKYGHRGKRITASGECFLCARIKAKRHFDNNFDARQAHLLSIAMAGIGTHLFQNFKSKIAAFPVRDDKFWRDVLPQENGCWIWKRRKRGTISQYGYIQRGKRQISSHRYAFYLFTGKWPEKHVLHRCDVPLCCNPSHLWEGTHTDNMQDKMAKGRHRSNPLKGSSSPLSKLKNADVPMIKLLLAHRVHHAQIAKIYGVAETTISSISGGYSWKHIPSWPDVFCSTGQSIAECACSQMGVP